VAEIIGGTWFKAAASSKVLVAGGRGARRLADRDRAPHVRHGARWRLPRALAHVHPGRQVPQRAILFIAAINLVTALVFANSFEMLTTLVCFGALVGFLMLHASVLVQFRRQKSSQWARHVVVPLAAPRHAYVLWNMARNAQLVGLAGWRSAERPGFWPGAAPRSGPEPGVAHLQIDGGLAVAEADVQAGVHAEQARQLVAETNGAAPHVAGRGEQLALGVRAAITTGTHQAPARPELPARLDFGGGHLVTLVPHRRDTAQLDIGPQEEWRAVG
jgi:hypothetical protein